MKNAPQEIESPLMRGPEDAARFAGIGRTKLFEAIREGHLPARKLGRRTLIADADLRTWLSNLPLAGHQTSAA